MHPESAGPSTQNSQTIPVYARYPRQLIVYDKVNNAISKWSSTTNEDILVATHYVAVSYRQSDFPDRENLEVLVQNVCLQCEIYAYWLDFACTGKSQEEKDKDLYRIADVFRWAEMTMIVIKGTLLRLSAGWLSWGGRRWTCPEALLSKKFICVGEDQQPVVMDLRMVANHAYPSNDDEDMLITVYSTSGKDFIETYDRVEKLCKAIRSRYSGPDASTRRTEGEFTAYRAEWVYAMMGFLPRRIQPSREKSEKEAFMELLELNGYECDESGWQKICSLDWKDPIGIRRKGSNRGNGM